MLQEDFDGYVVGQPPPDPPWKAISGNWIISTNFAHSLPNSLHQTMGGEAVIAYSELGSETLVDYEVLFNFYIDSIDVTRISVLLRGIGWGASYIFGVQDPYTLVVWKNGGTVKTIPYSIEGDSRYWIRARVTGIIPLIQAKIWKDGETEPTDWTIEWMDTETPRLAGSFAFRTYDAGVHYIDDVTLTEVVPKHKAVLSITVDKTYVDIGEIITFSGGLICPICNVLADKTVRLVENSLGEIGTTITDAEGLWSIALDTSEMTVGPYFFHADFDGDEFHIPSSSGTVVIIIEMAPPVPQVIIRNGAGGYPNLFATPQDVDAFVANNPFANACTIYLDPYYILTYTEATKENSFYQGLKAVVQRFHEFGWKTLLEQTAIAWKEVSGSFYDYILTLHPELCFVNAYGQYMGLPPLNGGDGRASCVIDWHAHYATDDLENSVTAGIRLGDIWTSRITDMIRDGIHWDGWFGSDGFNGFGMHGYDWLSDVPTDFPSCSDTEIAEWVEWTTTTLPPDWDTLTTVEKAQWIQVNAKEDWHNYWTIRFAMFYAQIKTAIKNANPNALGTFVQADDACAWEAVWPYHTPYGLWNVPVWQEYGSFDFYFILDEKLIPKIEAYAGALIKGKDYTTHCIPAVQPAYYGVDKLPWENKQTYLADVINYIIAPPDLLYKVCDADYLWMQYPEWSQINITDVMNWITNIAPLFRQALTPIYLGDIFVMPPTAVSEEVQASPLIYSQWIDEKIWGVKAIPPNPVDPIGIIEVCDHKIFRTGNKTIITMMNMSGGGSGADLLLTVDLTNLAMMGVIPPDPSKAKIYWQSDKLKVPVTDWSNVSLKLRGGADVLVIEPLAPIPLVPIMLAAEVTAGLILTLLGIL